MSTATVGQLTRSALKHAPSEADANANESWAAAPAPAGHSNEWPEPLPLEGELPQVMAFDERLLPESLRPLVCDVADRMQVPLDFPAAVMLLTLAGTVGRRARIQPKAVDSSWIVVPNMWGGIVAPPGQLKSPVITAMTAPLRAIEREWRGDFANAEASPCKPPTVPSNANAAKLPTVIKTVRARTVCDNTRSMPMAANSETGNATR